MNQKSPEFLPDMQQAVFCTSKIHILEKNLFATYKKRISGIRSERIGTGIRIFYAAGYPAGLIPVINFIINFYTVPVLGTLGIVHVICLK